MKVKITAPVELMAGEVNNEINKGTLTWYSELKAPVLGTKDGKTNIIWMGIPTVEVLSND